LFYYGSPSPQIQESEARELRGRGGRAATTVAQTVTFKHQQVCVN